MRNIKLKVAYVGTKYKGFQKQPGGCTIQDALEEFLAKVCGESVTVYGSGRTDAGVHALGQVVSFTTDGVIPCDGLILASRGMLPKDIVILSAEEVPLDFHARFSAKWKEYSYRICMADRPDPFLADRVWFVEEPLDVEKMHKAAKFLLGKHDFSAFCSSGADTTNFERTIYSVNVNLSGNMVHFNIVGNGFLYHMVRNIMWSLVQVGKGKRTQEEFECQFNLPKDSFEMSPAPAGGLYLVNVGYDNYGEKY